MSNYNLYISKLWYENIIANNEWNNCKEKRHIILNCIKKTKVSTISDNSDINNIEKKSLIIFHFLYQRIFIDKRLFII